MLRWASSVGRQHGHLGAPRAGHLQKHGKGGGGAFDCEALKGRKAKMLYHRISREEKRPRRPSVCKGGGGALLGVAVARQLEFEDKEDVARRALTGGKE